MHTSFSQNTIVCELRDAHIPELKSVTTRSRAMVTCYPGEQRGYTKHCDNAVRNGRKLTAILYLNNDWTQADGGELKIYPSYTTEGSNVTRRLMLEGVFGYNPNNCFVTDNAIAIRPIANRLVLFWSNMRCPHEVTFLPLYTLYIVLVFLASIFLWYLAVLLCFV